MHRGCHWPDDRRYDRRDDRRSEHQREDHRDRPQYGARHHSNGRREPSRSRSPRNDDGPQRQRTANFYSDDLAQQQQQQPQHKPPPPPPRPPQPSAPHSNGGMNGGTGSSSSSAVKSQRVYWNDSDSDDSMPDMSRGAAPAAPAATDNVARQVCAVLVDVNANWQKCPFCQSRFGELERINHDLYLKFKDLYDISTQVRDGRDGCCCTGTNEMRVAQIYHHARDTVSKSDGDARKEVHRALVSFIDEKCPAIKESFDKDEAERSKPTQPVEWELVSRPPILELRTDPKFDEVVRYKQRLVPLLKNIASEATGYHPVIGAPKSAADTNSYEGRVLLVFDGGDDAARQDELLLAACRLRDECNRAASNDKEGGAAYFVKPGGAQFLSQEKLERLEKKNVFKELGGKQFAERLEWRALNKELARIEGERKAKAEADEQEKDAMRARLGDMEAQMAKERASFQSEQDRQRAWWNQMCIDMGESMSKTMQKEREQEDRLRDNETKLRNLAHERSVMERLVRAKEREMADVLAQHAASSAESQQQQDAVYKEQLDKAQQLLEEKEEEIAEAKAEAAKNKEEADSYGVNEAQAAETRQYQTALTIVDHVLKKSQHKDALEHDERFGLRTPGELVHDKLRELGVKLPRDPMTATDKEMQTLYEVANWAGAITGAGIAYKPPDIPDDLPTFVPDDAFIREENSNRYEVVREKDEAEKWGEPVYNMATGEPLRRVNGDPVCKLLNPGHSAAFVKSIRKRYKRKADGILEYLMRCTNDYMADALHATNYSAAFIPYDRLKNKDMTPAQRVAFLLDRLGAGDDQLVHEALEE